MPRPLNPKLSEIDHFFFCLILVVHLGHGKSSAIQYVLAVFSPNRFLGQDRSLAPELRNLFKKLVHFYRDTRPRAGGSLFCR